MINLFLKGFHCLLTKSISFGPFCRSPLLLFRIIAELLLTYCFLLRTHIHNYKHDITCTQKPPDHKKSFDWILINVRGCTYFCCGHQNGTIDMRYMRSKQQSNDNTLIYRFEIICLCVFVYQCLGVCCACLGECICAALIKSPNVFIIILWNQNRMCFCWQYVACGACFDSSFSLSLSHWLWLRRLTSRY